MFVTRVEPDTLRVVLGTADDLLQSVVHVGKVNYVGGNPPPGPVQVGAKIRYNGGQSDAVLEPDGDAAILRFESPQRAVTPGQAAVFFVGDRVLGGGYIEGMVG
jgi:tRNA-specific 2-thiouridylase